MPQRDAPHVMVLVDTATGWGRRLIRGVNTYAQKHGPWHLWVEARGQDEKYKIPRGWRGDGIIARVGSQAMATHLKQSRLPVVNISGIELKGVRFPRVTSSYQDTARLAVEHFVERGFHQFGYCGIRRISYIAAHQHAFVHELAQRGFSCHSFEFKPRRLERGPVMERLAYLRQWVEHLPKPIGLFTWATASGREVLEACRMADIAVPHEVAVLGGDYDELLSDTSSPAMSGIAVPSEQIGYEATAMLDALIRGDKPATTTVYISPTGVIESRSTDTLAIDDPDVLQAVRFIREHAYEPIQVADILRKVPTSRRHLERKFIQHLGRTPSEEIRQLRIAKAKSLLAQTDLNMDQVAESVGYASHNYLNRTFKAATGLTPKQYRTRVRGR